MQGPAGGGRERWQRRLCRRPGIAGGPSAMQAPSSRKSLAVGIKPGGLDGSVERRQRRGAAEALLRRHRGAYENGE